MPRQRSKKCLLWLLGCLLPLVNGQSLASTAGDAVVGENSNTVAESVSDKTDSLADAVKTLTQPGNAENTVGGTQASANFPTTNLGLSNNVRGTVPMFNQFQGSNSVQPSVFSTQRSQPFLARVVTNQIPRNARLNVASTNFPMIPSNVGTNQFSFAPFISTADDSLASNSMLSGMSSVPFSVQTQSSMPISQPLPFLNAGTFSSGTTFSVPRTIAPYQMQRPLESIAIGPPEPVGINAINTPITSTFSAPRVISSMPPRLPAGALPLYTTMSRPVRITPPPTRQLPIFSPPVEQYITYNSQPAMPTITDIRPSFPSSSLRQFSASLPTITPIAPLSFSRPVSTGIAPLSTGTMRRRNSITFNGGNIGAPTFGAF